MQEWIIILIRSAALFFLMLVLVRIMGKRNISRLNPFNYIIYLVAAIIAALVSLNIVRNVVSGLVALGIWVVFSVVLEYMSLKSKWVHDWVNGKETILVKQGKVMEENLSQARLSAEELLRELRTKGIFSMADVEFAILETTGEINVLLKSDRKPVTLHDLGRDTVPESEPQTVIIDGNILNEPLANIGLNPGWLNEQLENTGVSLDNVFIGQVDTSGTLYVDLFDDAIQIPQPRVKEMLYAKIEKSQADFESFSLESGDENIKNMYLENSNKLDKVLKKLKPYLLQ